MGKLLITVHPFALAFKTCYLADALGSLSETSYVRVLFLSFLVQAVCSMLYLIENIITKLLVGASSIKLKWFLGKAHFLQFLLNNSGFSCLISFLDTVLVKCGGTQASNTHDSRAAYHVKYH